MPTGETPRSLVDLSEVSRADLKKRLERKSGYREAVDIVFGKPLTTDPLKERCILILAPAWGEVRKSGSDSKLQKLFQRTSLALEVRPPIEEEKQELNNPFLVIGQVTRYGERYDPLKREDRVVVPINKGGREIIGRRTFPFEFANEPGQVVSVKHLAISVDEKGLVLVEDISGNGTVAVLEKRQTS